MPSNKLSLKKKKNKPIQVHQNLVLQHPTVDLTQMSSPAPQQPQSIELSEEEVHQIEQATQQLLQLQNFQEQQSQLQVQQQQQHYQEEHKTQQQPPQQDASVFMPQPTHQERKGKDLVAMAAMYEDISPPPSVDSASLLSVSVCGDGGADCDSVGNNFEAEEEEDTYYSAVKCFLSRLVKIDRDNCVKEKRLQEEQNRNMLDIRQLELGLERKKRRQVSIADDLTKIRKNNFYVQKALKRFKFTEHSQQY